jgi:hypothetical protein
MAVLAPNFAGGFAEYLDALISVVAHEVTEWATDPDGKQYRDDVDKKENGDKCKCRPWGNHAARESCYSRKTWRARAAPSLPRLR